MTRSLALLVVGLLTACGPGPALYTAQPATSETVVDGEIGEWPAALRPVPSEAGLGIGLRRDGEDLVVAVVASDERQARRLALGGLTLWVDPEGGTGRALGLRYPAPPDLTPVEIRARVAARRSGSSDDAPLRRRYQEATDQIEVTRGVVTQRAATDGRFGGLEAASTWDGRRLVVEMRVPLTVASGLLTEAPTEAVGLGVELLDVRRPAIPRGRRPTAGAGPAVVELPEAEVATVTRWLRLDW